MGSASFVDSGVSPTEELPYDSTLWLVATMEVALYRMLKEATLSLVAANKEPEVANRAGEYCWFVMRNLAFVDMVFHDTPSISWVVLDTNGTTFALDYHPPLEASLISCCRYSSWGPPNSTDLTVSIHSYNYLDRPQYRLRAMSQPF